MSHNRTAAGIEYVSPFFMHIMPLAKNAESVFERKVAAITIMTPTRVETRSTAGSKDVVASRHHLPNHGDSEENRADSERHYDDPL
jgi:hypothetical protein